MKFYFTIYALPFPTVVFIVLAASLVWYMLRRHFGKYREFTLFSSVLAAVWLFLVLLITVFTRSPGESEVVLQPFAQICSVINGGNPETMRTFGMNIFMFVPCGLVFPALLPGTWDERRRSVITVLLACVPSLGIELCQWYWRLGTAETDDVIANTFGAAVSCILTAIIAKYADRCRK